MTPATRARIPAHLRQYVVDQDYDAYDEVDQAVWRFVMLQLYDSLRKTAHPAYVDGLAETGISVERIPSVGEMDRCLAEYGWGAVTVDGFIPPRAFQEFQALGIMTIAAAIRRRRHLAYTPARTSSMSRPATRRSSPTTSTAPFSCASARSARSASRFPPIAWSTRRSVISPR